MKRYSYAVSLETWGTLEIADADAKALTEDGLTEWAVDDAVDCIRYGNYAINEARVEPLDEGREGE